MAITITYGGLNLNDGSTYFLLDGFDPGEKLKTWDEVRSYAGGVTQTNVSEANLIEVTVPLKIQAASLAGLHSAIDAINAKIDAGPQTLAWNDGSGNVNYSIGHSQRVHYTPTAYSVNKFWTVLDLILVRTA